VQGRGLLSHAGAARFARNHMLALVKAVLEQRSAERTYGIAEDDLTPGLGWSLPALRRVWNQRKAVVAPWWAENSKEAYNTGLDSLARSLEAWSTSRAGQRPGASVGFPRFHARRGRACVRFTTGTIRAEADRHHVSSAPTCSDDRGGRCRAAPPGYVGNRLNSWAPVPLQVYCWSWTPLVVDAPGVSTHRPELSATKL
jgi:hypothetical protein